VSLSSKLHTFLRNDYIPTSSDYIQCSALIFHRFYDITYVKDGDDMKKVMLIVFLLLTLLLHSCAFLLPEDDVLQSLGEYGNKEEGVNAGFRDVTIYIKYYYDDIDLTGNNYFDPVTEENLSVLGEYVADFEKWVACVKESEAFHFYDFSLENADDQDYLYLLDESDEGLDKEDYKIYFFDSQTNVLYYFRNTW